MGSRWAQTAANHLYSIWCNEPIASYWITIAS